MAVWDPDREEFQSICRCMSGFTDVFYAEATARLQATAIPGPKPYYNTGESPSVWFEPTEVWEIRGADLTLSPVHRAAQGLAHPERGIGLRFPRFLRIRDDKSTQDATDADTIKNLYDKQSSRFVSGTTTAAVSSKTIGEGEAAAEGKRDGGGDESDPHDDDMGL